VTEDSTERTARETEDTTHNLIKPQGSGRDYIFKEENYMVVQHNMQALNANRMLGVTTGLQAKSTEKLSSGYKINRAADDAAGLSISEKMRKQIKGLDQASTNAQDGISAVQTAEGALTEVHSMLQRMNELAVQASNGTNSESDRQSIQDEIDQLTTEIDRVAETTKFNETYLLKGNGKNTTVKIDAKDAGIEGALTGVGTGNATFKMDALKTGEQITIGSKGYTIGTSVDEIKGKITATGDAALAAGSKVTINGKAYTVAGEGYAVDTTENVIEASEIAKLVSDGDKVTIGSEEFVAMVDGTAATAAEITSVLEEDDVVTVGSDDYTMVDDLTAVITQGMLTAGKTITIDGEDFTITGGTPAAGELTAAEAMTKLGTAKVASYDGGTAYAEDLTDVLEDGVEVSVERDGDAVTFGTEDVEAVTIGETILTADKVGDNDASVITKEKAYELIAKELEAAGSIGTDAGKEATITKQTVDGKEQLYKIDGEKVVFEIKEGEVETKQGLQFTLHVGADADENNKIALTIDAMDSTSLGVSGLNLVDNTGAKATYAIDSIADAVAKVSAQRSALGAIQNRLEHTIANLDNVVENTTSAESSIRDTDMAEEMVNYSKNNILAQAGQAMLAQANTSTQGVLSLLG